MRSKSEIDALLRGLSPAEMADMLSLLNELDERKRITLAQNDFLAFIGAVDGNYKFGTHLKRLGNLLMGVEVGEHDRIAVSMAPRFGKSQMISIYYPAWYLGKHPDHKVIVASHTADLAVDMARKVRNLMQTDEYRRIFPDVAIAADAKAAGKWNTNKGGEYYACLRRFTLIPTHRGFVPAGQIVVGDRLRNASGYVTVQAVYDSEHTATHCVAGLYCSAEHPIWTLNRGWVYAQNIRPDDLLCVESIWDTMKALILGVLHGNLEHADVPPLVQHQKPLHKPEQREMGVVWRARDRAVRAVARVRDFLLGYGRPAPCSTHHRQDRRGWSIQPGELPVGDTRGAGEQQAQQRFAGWADTGAACSQAWGDARDNSVPYSNGGRPVGTREEAQEELRSYGSPDNLGWVRSAAARFFGVSSASRTPDEPRCGAKGYLARASETAQRLLGIFVGVRAAGNVAVIEHEDTPFVNFLTDGDHTFFADGVLTHNCGTGGALAGRGGHLIIIDDPLSEQDIKSGNTDSLDTTYEWFRAGLRTRLMPGGKICILHTRWHARDLIGRLIKDSAMNSEADQYEVFEFPAILNEGTDDEKSLWPAQWPLESLQRTKASMPAWQWNAQYQQNPTAQESALIKRDWIQWWPKEDPPPCDFIVQAWDTALTTKERSDYSVCQTWGVFTDETTNQTCAILLNRVKGKWEFPDLKQVAHDQVTYWEPDSLIVEAKASGQPLIDELRRSGVVVQDFSPGKGNDKIARVNAVVDMFASGQVWFPETTWAQNVVEELLAFPSAEHDDEVDTMTLALRRIRTGGLLKLANDRDFNDDYTQVRHKAYY